MENEIELLSQDGKVVVSSRVVAQDFGKQHKHVLEAIKNLELQLNTVEFSALFIESKYKATNGKMNKEYLLTRDGLNECVNMVLKKMLIMFSSKMTKSQMVDHKQTMH